MKRETEAYRAVRGHKGLKEMWVRRGNMVLQAHQDLPGYQVQLERKDQRETRELLAQEEIRALLDHLDLQDPLQHISNTCLSGRASERKSDILTGQQPNPEKRSSYKVTKP